MNPRPRTRNAPTDGRTDGRSTWAKTGAGEKLAGQCAGCRRLCANGRNDAATRLFFAWRCSRGGLRPTSSFCPPRGGTGGHVRLLPPSFHAEKNLETSPDCLPRAPSLPPACLAAAPEMLATVCRSASREPRSSALRSPRFQGRHPLLMLIHPSSGLSKRARGGDGGSASRLPAWGSSLILPCYQCPSSRCWCCCRCRCASPP